MNLIRARAKEVVSVELALFTRRVARECLKTGTPFSIENPSTSRLWNFEPITRLLADQSVCQVTFPTRMYGGDHKKPTTIVTNIPTLESLACKCCHPFRHRPLAGSRLAAALVSGNGVGSMLRPRLAGTPMSW